MGQRMNHAPVFFAVVQARFNQLMALDSYAPQIQDRLRKRGYPDGGRAVMTTVDIGPGRLLEQGPVPVAQATRYTFNNMLRTAGFLLDQSALTFQTTDYGVFESFSTQFITGLTAIHEVAELSFTERIGVRYLDAVFPSSGEKLEDYLAPTVMGLSAKIGGTLAHSFSETRMRVKDVWLLARAVIRDGELGFPPDLLPMSLQVDKRFASLKGRHAILDTDGWIDRREAFDRQGIKTRLNTIHEEVVSTFRATVTKHALERWS
jgi:uncharacterized protein (TIGR04255 family)